MAVVGRSGWLLIRVGVGMRAAYDGAVRDKILVEHVDLAIL